MDEERFWGLVGLLDGRVDLEGVEVLRDALDGGSERQREQFERELGRRLGVLMSPPVQDRLATYLRSTIRWGVSDDVIGFLACAIVAAGREFYDDAVGPGLLLEQRDWDLEGADLIMEFAEFPDEGLRTSTEIGLPWLSVNLGGSDGGFIRTGFIQDQRAYMAAQRLAASGRWGDWRRDNDIEDMHIEFGFYKDAEREKLSVRRRERNLDVSYDLPFARMPKLRRGSWDDLLESTMVSVDERLRRRRKRG